jgi:hypothetical protein
MVPLLSTGMFYLIIIDQRPVILISSNHNMCNLWSAYFGHFQRLVVVRTAHKNITVVRWSANEFYLDCFIFFPGVWEVHDYKASDTQCKCDHISLPMQLTTGTARQKFVAGDRH